MNTITLQTAVMLEIKEYIEQGISFSAHDVTTELRLMNDTNYFIDGLEYNLDGGYYVINHEDVKAIVVELFKTGLFDADVDYGSDDNGDSYIIYYVSTNGTSAPQGVVTQQVNPYKDKIDAYLENKKQATAKQIQSALKIKGLTCVDILGACKLKTDGYPSKAIING